MGINTEQAGWLKKEENGDANRAKYQAAQALVQIRKVKGLTQSQLAVVCGKPQSYISRIESGKQNITMEKLDEIVVAAGASLQLRIVF